MVYYYPYSYLSFMSFIHFFPLTPSENTKLYADALYDMSELYEDEGLSIVTPMNSFECLLKASELGHPRAQHKLATAYSTGYIHIHIYIYILSDPILSYLILIHKIHNIENNNNNKKKNI